MTFRTRKPGAEEKTTPPVGSLLEGGYGCLEVPMRRVDSEVKILNSNFHRHRDLENQKS